MHQTGQVTVPHAREQATAALEAGAWLTLGQIAALIGYSRSTAWRRLRRGDLRYRTSPGGQRSYHPDDVRALVAETQRQHGGTATE